MSNRQMIMSYLEDRIIKDGETAEIKMTCGVPILGPLLWKVYYDDIIRLEMPEGRNLIAFADDLVTVSCGDIVQISHTNINN